MRLYIIPVFFNSELASVKAHDREVTQQARYAQDEVIWLPCDSGLLKVVGDLNFVSFIILLKTLPGLSRGTIFKPIRKRVLALPLDMLCSASACLRFLKNKKKKEIAD